MRPKTPPPPPKWKPQVGAIIPVYLPQEIIMGRVIKYITDDLMEAKLNVQHPMGKHHGFKYGSTVELTRIPARPTGEKWAVKEAIED